MGNKKISDSDIVKSIEQYIDIQVTKSRIINKMQDNIYLSSCIKRALNTTSGVH